MGLLLVTFVLCENSGHILNSKDPGADVNVCSADQGGATRSEQLMLNFKRKNSSAQSVSQAELNRLITRYIVD